MKKYIPGMRLFEVYDDNDICTAKVVKRIVRYCSSEKEQHDYMHALLTHTIGVTVWGFVKVYKDEQTYNEWPTDTK